MKILGGIPRGFGQRYGAPPQAGSLGHGMAARIPIFTAGAEGAEIPDLLGWANKSLMR